VVTLATAHPGKFGDAVERASGVRPGLPARAQGLFDREERFFVLPADLGAIEAFIAARAQPREGLSRDSGTYA
jgi:threonine synthase